MSKYQNEQVLASLKDKLEEFYFPDRFTHSIENYLPELWDKSEFIDRDSAEEDESYKQLIPYCVVISDDGKILTYTRGKVGREKRLHAKRSIGVGGHINPGENNFQDALRREIKEEIGIDVDSSYFAGFVDENDTEVGRVHLGLVFLVPIKTNTLTFEDCLLEAQFLSPGEIFAEFDSLENWSQIVIENLFGAYKNK